MLLWDVCHWPSIHLQIVLLHYFWMLLVLSNPTLAVYWGVVAFTCLLGTPVLALTATADLESRAIVKKQLNLDNATTVTVSPNRTNIRLGLGRVSAHSLDCLDWLVREVKEKGLTMSPVIIYCRTLKVVGRVFCHLKAELWEDAWVDQEHKVENLIIGMFHSHTLPLNKSRVLSSFTGEGNCRVVIATTLSTLCLLHLRIVLLPDMNYTGYFDEEDGECDHVLTPHSSVKSGLSVLSSD